VQVFANAAHRVLLQNFLCGLRSAQRHLLRHVVAWAGDAATARWLRSEWPAVAVVDAADVVGDDAEDAPRFIGVGSFDVRS